MDTENGTYVLLLSLIFILQAVALFLQYLVNRTYPGPGWWMLGAIALAAGFIANAARAHPVVGHAAVVANNALFTGGFVLLYIGIMRFLGRRERTALVLAYWLAVTLVAAYFILVQDDQALRRFNHSLSLAVFGGLIGGSLLRYSPALHQADGQRRDPGARTLRAGRPLCTERTGCPHPGCAKGTVPDRKRRATGGNRDE